MLIIGDVHGCYKTLLALLAQCPDDTEYVFVGDLIDRGPRSREVVEFVINGSYKCVEGNHEIMAIDYTLGRDYDGLFLANGGMMTLNSYPNLDFDPAHIKFFRSLPRSLRLDDGKLIVSHSGDVSDPWNRGYVMPCADGIFHVFGHTPHKGQIIEPNGRWANVDTGAFYYRRYGYGKLTMIQYPSRNIFQQVYVD